jgi:hypothetical protein
MPTQTTRSSKRASPRANDNSTKQNSTKQAPTPRSVLMRLTRGVSTHATWLLRSASSATTVTIGADPTCDWQIRGAGVPRHALSVALFDGGLFVASGPQAEITVEGARLPETWQRIDHALSIAMGDAQIDFAWELPADELTMSSERERPTFPDALLEQLDDSAQTQGARTSWVERVSRLSLLDSPSLLGRTAESRTGVLIWRYAGFVLFTALAYRAWLLLLDRL